MSALSTLATGLPTPQDDPSFAYAALYLKVVAPPQVIRGQIYRSSLSFLFLPATGLAICMIFPEVVLGLPGQVYGDE